MSNKPTKWERENIGYMPVGNENSSVIYLWLREFIGYSYVEKKYFDYLNFVSGNKNISVVCRLQVTKKMSAIIIFIDNETVMAIFLL